MTTCPWCQVELLTWWTSSTLCPVCRTLRQEVKDKQQERRLADIASKAKLRIFRDGRTDDCIPGIPERDVAPFDYQGKERRVTEGTIFDRKGYM